MEPTETTQVAYCRICGTALTPDEQHLALGTVYCASHVPPAAGPASPPPGSPWTTPPSAAPPPSYVAPQAVPSPGLAFVLGLIPGVGAIYNEQYGKGLVHVLILGLLISIANADSGDFQPLFGFLIPAWIIYMAFEAYHTARNRAEGRPVEEFSSIIPAGSARTPLGPILMIALGIVFLLNNFGLLRFSQIFRYWPVALIALGIYLLIERTGRSGSGVDRG